MSALFLLLVLVAGFLHCHIHPVQRIRLHRYAGQYLYLRAAGYGVRALAIAGTLALIANSLTTSELTALFRLSSYLENTVFVSENPLRDAWLLTLFIGMFAVVFSHAFGSFIFLCLRYRTLAPSHRIKGMILGDSPLAAQLYRLYLQRKPIMLSMADRKVYVGMIVDMGEPTETEGPDQEIALVPMLSGYRDKDTLKVEFTTFYKQFYDQQLGGERKVKALTLVLRQKDIVSATEFSDSAYAYWNKPKPGGKASPRVRPRYVRAC